MTESTPPDGHQPAEPPRIPETPSMQAYTGEPESSDDTPPRAPRPAPAPVVDPTAAFPASSQPPPNQPPPNQPPPNQPPAYQPPPNQPPAAVAPVAAPAPGGPSGPGYGGPPPGIGGPGGPGTPDGGPKKKSGLLVAGLIALVVALGGGLGFLALQSGGDGDADEPPTTRDDEDDEPDDTEPDDTQPDNTQPIDTEPDVTVTPTEPPVTDPPVNGTVDNLFVRVNSYAAVIADDQIASELQTLGQSTGDNPVATTDDVLNLCAAVALDQPAMASVEWTRDGSTVSTGASRVLEAPADGNCINNNGAPLDAGSYEVSFTDSGGAMSGVALFTVGADTVTQSFVNDTGADVCSVEVGPTLAGFYQPFTLTSGEPLIPDDAVLIDIAAIEHEGRAVDCDGNPLDGFFFTPSAVDEISLTDGSVFEEPVPTTVPPVVEITDLELNGSQGQIGSFSASVAPGAETETVIDILLTFEERLPIATTDESLALCAAWEVPGALEADIVWEFNRIEVARIPAVANDGRIGVCVPPGGSAFDEGAYQAYLQRGEVPSSVLTITLGRVETQLAFRNDTGVAICEVGFSPNLTNFYSFIVVSESEDFDEAIEPGESFTIVAPFIENDIKAIDCDGNDAAETFNIAPTDQTLSLSTGQP